MSHMIALVDDDRNILTSVSIALQSEGFVTRVYTDGVTALKAFAENPPDLGVFDIKMPQMDGMELLRRLREFSPMPVIFLISDVEQLVAVFDHPRALRKRFQDQEFGDGQGDLLAVPLHLVPGRVHRQPAAN